MARIAATQKFAGNRTAEGWTNVPDLAGDWHVRRAATPVRAEAMN